MGEYYRHGEVIEMMYDLATRYMVKPALLHSKPAPTPFLDWIGLTALLQSKPAACSDTEILSKIIHQMTVDPDVWRHPEEGKLQSGRVIISTFYNFHPSDGQGLHVAEAARIQLEESVYHTTPPVYRSKDTCYNIQVMNPNGASNLKIVNRLVESGNYPLREDEEVRHYWSKTEPERRWMVPYMASIVNMKRLGICTFAIIVKCIPGTNPFGPGQRVEVQIIHKLAERMMELDLGDQLVLYLSFVEDPHQKVKFKVFEGKAAMVQLERLNEYTEPSRCM